MDVQAQEQRSGRAPRPHVGIRGSDRRSSGGRRQAVTGSLSIARKGVHKHDVLCFQFTVVFPSWASVAAKTTGHEPVLLANISRGIPACCTVPWFPPREPMFTPHKRLHPLTATPAGPSVTRKQLLAVCRLSPNQTQPPEATMLDICNDCIRPPQILTAHKNLKHYPPAATPAPAAIPRANPPDRTAPNAAQSPSPHPPPPTPVHTPPPSHTADPKK